MKGFIRIQSKMTIRVTGGLDYVDTTNPNSRIADRLSVKPIWMGTKIIIKEGIGNYPAEIKNWPTVQALVKDKIITIGESDEDVTPEEQSSRESLLTEIKDADSRKKMVEKNVKRTLDQVSGD